jgi:hypothetical protein
MCSKSSGSQLIVICSFWAYGLGLGLGLADSKKAITQKRLVVPDRRWNH